MEQWALGGRRFGTIVSWFFLGGDLYTAYTFIAVPALVYGIGALGFFAVPYATLAYPIALVVLTRFWTIARARGYVTAADFIRDRYDDRGLEIAIALTGVVASMPYVALQLVGMRAVLAGNSASARRGRRAARVDRRVRFARRRHIHQRSTARRR